ncbi:hydrolase 1, exosortase A system-associated [Stakelama tenebrarum]|uniref:Hydrolase 1, exosortase A system-associated n=1 Tax=Stakelama tenebrarum TaxID=2711215 RepID=A0A6G6Y7Z5_9SPHN|nr:hydrolase 1, exosortase A system-associated [Sphingosinithalassobacter tenebrarum]QIG80696.1 hydrolase 1, exosortase A system-associated [Sphingosinithalassobacter tenebrarum]
MRKLIAFPCAGETLLGTLDEAPGTTGLLIVSGGNEIRIGAHRGQAMLAQRVAEKLGAPVFRYDRRGIGDSTGENGGFETTREDIAASVAAFREHTPQLERLVAFGNCDAATSLAFFHEQAGCDALLLANPWVIEEESDTPPAAAIRARYAEKLKDPREWLRLLRGGVDLRKLARGLAKVSAKSEAAAPEGLAARMASSLDASPVPVTILLARGDNTAIAFADAWKGDRFARIRTRVQFRELESDSHSFARTGDKAWLFERVREALR